MGRDETYEILNVLEFTSSRKRMSVIVRLPDNSIKLMIKGAVRILQAAIRSILQYMKYRYHLKIPTKLLIRWVVYCTVLLCNLNGKVH